MMAGEGYIQLPLIGDVDSLTLAGTDYMTAAMGELWVMRPANPETVLIEGAGQIAGELIDQAAVVPPEALAYIGTSIYNIPMEIGNRAFATATITFAPDVGAVMVPMDSEVAVPHPSGQSFIFTTDRDAPAPAGGGDVVVNVVALDVGAEQNGSFGESELVDVVEGVTMVMVGNTSGGVDPEDLTDYLDRLTTALQMPRRPVLPEDHGRLALQVPGVGKVAVYNLYYPGTTARDAGKAVGDYAMYTPQPAPAAAANNIARCTSVAITGPDGADPSVDLMNAVYALLDANREINFLNFVLKPVQVSVDVQAKIKPYPNDSYEDAAASAEASIRSWLSSEGWSTGPTSTENSWNPDTKVRLYEAVDYLNRSPAVWYCEQVKLKFTAQPPANWVAADLDMTTQLVGYTTPAVLPICGVVELTPA
jgi:uncharacterized phage protein gp47/JayE